MNRLLTTLFSVWLPISTLALEKEAREMPKGGIDKALLGQILFFDNNLSFHGNQSCSSCHSPDTAFVDLRENSADKIVSQGDDPKLFGTRNAPTMLYASYAPEFHYDEKIQDYVGGQFWDGRAKNLSEQAGGPPINPVEMGMPDKLSVAKRIYNTPMYFMLLTQHYGEATWDSVDSVYAAMEDALAVFQKEKRLLHPFDSKYDKSLQDKYAMTAQEKRGQQLFFDNTKTNCSNCHQAQHAEHKEETFTNYRYYNMGVPKNQRLIAHNQLGQDFIDNGLLDNPMVKGDQRQKGKFKVPTLRNIAVTAPYMHNGVFKHLRTALEYFDHFNNPARKLNPETQQPWDAPEYAATMNQDDLKAPALSDEQLDDLEAFLKTLTDERYETLLRQSEKRPSK